MAIEWNPVTIRLLFIGLWLLLQGCQPKSSPRPARPEGVFYVTGRFLTDPCGNMVVLRGINKMSVFDETDPYGAGYFPEIARTGANCVRIVWQTRYSNGQPTRTGHLDTLIANCIAQRMIPMVEMHDATCDLSRLPLVLDYWTRSDVVQVIQKYEHALLVNIANEAGNDAVSESQFVQAYQGAITRLRNAGIRTPLIIDATDCGKNLDILMGTATQLIQHDPQRNVLFSVHPYWSKLAVQQFATPTFIRDQLLKAATAEIPLILGEVCAYGGWPGPNEPDTAYCGAKSAVDYQTLITESNRFEIGWLLWEWGPGNGYYNYTPPYLCPGMDITTNGTYTSLLATRPDAPNAWALDAVIGSPNSIQNTSLKTDYIRNGFRCP